MDNDVLKIGIYRYYRGYEGTIEYSKTDKIYYGTLVLKNDYVGYHADSLDGLYKEFKKAVDDYIEVKAELDNDTNTTSKSISKYHKTQEYIKKYYSNKLCAKCPKYLCKVYGARCRKYRFCKFLRIIKS